MPRPRAIVLRAPGTNCDEETAAAWEQAGAVAETWHVGRLLDDPQALDAFQILTIPGGFSYGDDLGAGRILATRLGIVLQDALRRLHDRGGLVMGICNGFQVLVRAGLLPGNAGTDGPTVAATLTNNDSGHYESRWVRLAPTPGLSPFVTDDTMIELPVGHGEGKFVVNDRSVLAALEAAGQVVLRYCDEAGEPTQQYPANPNGSLHAAAGVCDPSGRIFGLMPHPDRHFDPLLHPRWTRRGLAAEGDGLRLFRNAVEALR
jgi:phosphoribosylformylglycinamidine synthase subunit PurQ / glutaminase